MSKQNATFFTNGTSALRMEPACPKTHSAKIIPFEKRDIVRRGERRVSRALPETKPTRQRSVLKNILESSEMYCSLKLESFLGCPYGALSIRNITCIAVGSTVIGLISLILGS